MSSQPAENLVADRFARDECYRTQHYHPQIPVLEELFALKSTLFQATSRIDALCQRVENQIRQDFGDRKICRPKRKHAKGERKKNMFHPVISSSDDSDQYIPKTTEPSLHQKPQL